MAKMQPKYAKNIRFLKKANYYHHLLAIINNVIGNGLMKAPKNAKDGQNVAKMAKKRQKYQIS